MIQKLSNYLEGIGAKKLSAVEVNPEISNQHEFNGINKFRSFLGERRKTFHGKFIYLADNPDDTLIQDGTLTWYDARENHPSRTEYRLYYSRNAIIDSANLGDFLIIGKTKDDDLIVIVAESGSTSERQMMWLFGLEEVESRFVIKNFSDNDEELDFSGKQVLETLDIEIQEETSGLLELIIQKFGEFFPKTKDFSQFARETIPTDVSAIDEPDKTLLSWLEYEEQLFKTLEKHIVSKKLSEGFGDDGLDVDSFVKYSLSVHNRRKSRAGHSFENHLAVIFDENNLQYSKGQKTERNNKPDFLFPSIENYRDEEFDFNMLTMLGVKTSAKDRWRQVLSEANRINEKHLITLQPAISVNQTEEMKQQRLQLVIPASIIRTYTQEQQNDLMDLSSFIQLVRTKQISIDS